MRPFLELCSIFQQFVLKFARISAPLVQRLKKDQSATFLLLSGKDLKVMKKLEAALMTFPTLALPYSADYLTLNTDAYNVQVGCILLQEQLDDTTKYIAYWSQLLANT